ncbi:MAG: UbiA family prenyltransferase [Candidatus Limnocylindrales bacterium]
MTALLRLVHPFPSALNALLVLGIALIAGAPIERAGLLALTMLGLQFCIGAVNDLFDEALDAKSKPFKPIPAGRVSRRAAWLVAAVFGGGGLALSGLVNPPDLLPLALAATMLGAGLVYDAVLKPTAFGWVCFAVAFPLLPIYAWYGSTGTLPPQWEILVPVAILAGPALQLANGVIDLETDRAAGLRTFAVALGRRRSLALMAVALVVIHALAWITLLPTDAVEADGSAVAVALLSGTAGALALGGMVASAQRTRVMRETGWTAQAASIATLALAWLLGASA